jgi:hypothetical protein
VKCLRQIKPHTTEAEIQKKWNGLRNTYMNERKKMKYTHHSGAGDDTVSLTTVHHKYLTLKHLYLFRYINHHSGILISWNF